MRSLSLLPLLFLCLGYSAGAAQEFPFRLVNGFLLVSGKLAGKSENLTLLVDSGASATVLDFRTARRLRVALGEKEAVQGVGSEATAHRLRNACLTLGGERVDDASLALDLSNALTLCGERVDGLLGAGFFAQRVVQIDYPQRKLRFLKERTEPAAAAIRLPLRQWNGIFCAPVAVNGSQPRWVRVDTGCNDELHWVIPRGPDRRQRRTTIGFVDEEQNITRTNVRLGGRDLPDVETSLHGRALFPGESGLLGNGLLSRYVVTFDGPAGVLWMHE